MGGGGGMAQPPPGIHGVGPPSATQQQPIIGEPFIPGQSSIKTRDILYRLVISQLFYDGYQQVAVALSNIGRFLKIIIKFDFLSIVHTDPPCPPSDRLMQVLTLGLEREAEGGNRTHNKAEAMLGPGLDLEYETEMGGTAPEPATYRDCLCDKS